MARAPCATIITGMFLPFHRTSRRRRTTPSGQSTAADLDRRLRTERTLWLSTVDADGSPHLVPVWFNWDGEAVWIFSKPHAVKVRNIRRNARVSLAVGEPLDDFDVQLIHGQATLVTEPTAEVLREAHRRKFAAALRDVGLTWDEYSATYSQAIRIEPTRFLPWRGRTHLGADLSLVERRASLLARLFSRPAPLAV